MLLFGSTMMAPTLAATSAPTPAASTASAPAAGTGDLQDWLQKVSRAAHELNYRGVFVTQDGDTISTSSLEHYVVPQGHFERIETLDGQRRVLVCINDEIRTMWPDYKLTLIDNQPGNASFPRLLKTADGEVNQNYQREPEGEQRCIGRQCQVTRLVPRDHWRWGYRLWTLSGSDLLVKAQTIDAAGKVVNQVAFTEVDVGIPPRPQAVRAALRRTEGFTVEQMRAQPVNLLDAGWKLDDGVPGFETIGVYRRSMMVGEKSSEVLQWLLSDGLASVSIFIQPMHSVPASVPEEQRVGGTLALSRRVGDWWVTVMGAVPDRTLRRISTGIARVQ